jgi:glyoxylase-like metal-dependent hydrolase (beta-lactamase superfamily II)
LTSRRDWQRLGITEVAPQVWRIPLTLPDPALGAVNAYGMLDDDGLVIIDPGQAFTGATQQLATALEAIGFGLANIRGALITHIHLDHFTNAVTLRRELGARIWLGIGERPGLRVLQQPMEGRIGGLLQLLPSWGAGRLVPLLADIDAGGGMPVDIWEEPDFWLEPDQDVPLSSRTLRVLATPGHTQGHVVLHDRSSGLLFSGDHVLPDITPSIGFEPIPAAAPLADYLSSLERMLTLPDARMLPAHGPVRESVHHRVHELMHHHDDRLEASFDQVLTGRTSVWEVARGLRWTRRLRHVDELDILSQALAVLETKAHLEVLVARGRISLDDTGTELAFTPVVAAAGQPR